MTLLMTMQAAHAARIHYIFTNGWWVRTRVFGTSGAPRVVLVHGLGVSGLYLIPTAVELADQFELWVPDLPGFGASRERASILDIPELADAVAGILAYLGDGPISLLGNSLGCQILVDLALRYPERVDRLVLVGPSVDPLHRSASAQTARLLVDGLRERSSLVPLAFFDYMRAGWRRCWRTLGYALADPIEDKLSLVPHRSLVVRGGRDPIVPQRWAQEVVALLPDAALLVVSNTAHAVNYSAPRRLAALVRPFLSA